MSDQRTVIGQILQQTFGWISTPWTTVSVVPAQPQVVIWTINVPLMEMKTVQNTSMVELTELVQPSGVWPFDRLFAEVPFQRHGLYSDLVSGIGAGCHSPLSL